MKEDPRITWGLILMNAAFAFMNAGFAVSNIYDGKWTGLFSLAAAIFNGGAAWFIYKGFQQRERQRKGRVWDYLSGKIG